MKRNASPRQSKLHVTRRTLLAGAAGGLAAGLLPRIGYTQAKTTTITMQLGWLAGDNQTGEIVAKQLGYMEEEKINLVISAGGPNNDGVAVVASGRADVGQISSSPSLMLAASQKIPVRCFAVGCQEHPYAYHSLPAKPVRTAEDMIGKKIGIQATGKILLSALLKKHNIPEDKVEVVVIGSDMAPLLTGQVDAIAGWLTNTTALRVLGPDRISMRLWDQGIQLYGLPYYTTDDSLAKNREALTAFTRAAARGWAYAYQNPDKAVDLLVKEYPNLVHADEIEAVGILNKFVFTAATKAGGWGTFDPQVWQNQIDTYDQLQQFRNGAPKLADVIDASILDATKDVRPKLG